MTARIIDDNSAVDFIDDNSVISFLDDLGNFTVGSGLISPLRLRLHA